MHKTQFEALRQQPAAEPMLHVGVVGTHPRTLAYGYTTRRDTWHAYVFDGQIHVAVYEVSGDAEDTVRLLGHVCGDALPVESLRPTKRVYPNRCDYAFALLMRAAGEPLPFGNWDEAWGEAEPEGPYHGVVFDRGGERVAVGAPRPDP